MKFKYLKASQIILLHDLILGASGGLMGVDKNKLDGILGRIDTNIFYHNICDIYEIAALYAITIAQGHPFNDGNKRTALSSMLLFFSINNLKLILMVTENVIEDKIVDVAEKKVSREELSSWIKKHKFIIL